MSSVLLVDDEPKIRLALSSALRDDGFEVVEAPGARDAQRLLNRRFFDVLVVDNMMPDMTGLDLLREIGQSAPATGRPEVVVMTAYATVESAIEAIKLGAFDYLQKPFEVDELLVVVRRALSHGRLTDQHRYLLDEREEEYSHYGIVGRSMAIQEVIRTAQLVANAAWVPS